MADSHLRITVLLLLVTHCLPATSSAIGASGISTQIMDARAFGQGNAFAGQADGPAAIYFNPAGITQLPGTQVSAGAALVHPFVDRTGGHAPTDKMKRELSALPNFYLTHRIDLDRPVSFGVGLNAPFNVKTHWSPTSSVRYVATESSFEMIQVNPTIAYQIAPSVSLGVGADYANLLKVVQANHIDQSAIGAGDGTSHLSGDGSGWGYNGSLLWKPSHAHSFGAGYRSQIRIPIQGSAELSGIHPTFAALAGLPAGQSSFEATSSFIVPASALFGYCFRPNARWTLLFDYEWTQWNAFETQEVSAPALASTPLGTVRKSRQWRNVSSVALGANVRLNEAWQVRGGYAFFQRTVPEEKFSPDIPDSAKHLVTAGFSRTWSAWIFDLGAGAYIHANRTITHSDQSPDVNGTYKALTPTLVTNVTYKFGAAR